MKGFHYNDGMNLFLLSFLTIFAFSGHVVRAQDKAKDQTIEMKVLFIGDSLTEGYGINKEKSYPLMAKNFLEAKNIKIEVLNGSVSGSTTASGLSRLKWFLKGKPDLLFLALGANDGLRGIKVSESEKNLLKTIKLAKENGVKVALAGMMVPPNYGPEYGKQFQAMYKDLSKKENIPLMPFLLKGVAGENSLNQEDGIHPNEAGHKLMGENVASFLKPLLKKE